MLSSFSDLFQREFFQPECTFAPHYRDKFLSRHIVFVDGLLNEAAQLVGNYFCDNISEVERIGIQQTHIGYLSSVTVPDNADKLFAAIQKIHTKQKCPLILIGHSKGGAESLYCVLKYPELLISGMVDRVVLIHGAIGGSPLSYRVSDNFAGRSFSKYLGMGLVSLRPDVARKSFDDIFESFRKTVATVARKETVASSDSSNNISDDSNLCSLTDEVFKKLSNRVFYIRGKCAANTLCWGVRFVIYFCKAPLDPTIPNDGLLHCNDQMYKNFGVDLGILECDHIDLVIGGMVTNAAPDRRKAFTRAFLSAIYQSEILEESSLRETMIKSSSKVTEDSLNEEATEDSLKSADSAKDNSIKK